MPNILHVLRQLGREMGFPLLIAVIWTIYSLVVAPDKRNLVNAFSIFLVPPFFSLLGVCAMVSCKKVTIC